MDATNGKPPSVRRDLEAERERLLALMEKNVDKDLSRQLQELEPAAGTVCIEPVLVETDGTFHAHDC